MCFLKNPKEYEKKVLLYKQILAIKPVAQ